MLPSSDNLSQASSTRVSQPQQLVHQSFAGPIPPPNLLEAYNKIVPNAAERLIKMAEDNSQHLRDVEQKALDANIAIEHKHIEITKRGQNYAFCFVISLLITVMVTAWLKAYWVAGVIGITSVASIVIAFISGGKLKQDEAAKPHKKPDSNIE